MKALVLILLLVGLAPIADATSFDCKKAATFAERTVCADTLLGSLDDALAQNYRHMRAANIGSGALKDLQATQKSWLSVRDQCKDKQCLIDAYRKRIDQVCDYPVLSGMHPICVESDSIK